MSAPRIDPYQFQRLATQPVRVGSLVVGGQAPISVQSMTTTPTADVAATVAQSLRLAEAGCQIIRITAPTVAEAAALARIRAGLDSAGWRDLPLVADIHFMPAAAMEAVEHVEKVRINPGNYADRKRFQVIEYSDADYAAELERLHQRFSPLVKRAKALGRALRIGVNHGSLSDRIMNRYGDTPQGMVASALEFIHICEDHAYRDSIISMKSSNPKVMVEAYRLLVAALQDHGWVYPLHLGVTEAGDGEDGRVKGACGIGALLADGIGDTIRVSLTEEPEAEIPVARRLVELYSPTRYRPRSIAQVPGRQELATSYHRRASEIVRFGGDEGLPIGGGQLAKVLVSERIPADDPASLPADLRLADRLPAVPVLKRPASLVPVPAACLRVPVGASIAVPAAPAVVLLEAPDGDWQISHLQHSLAQLPGHCLVGWGALPLADRLRAYRALAACDDAAFAAAEASRVGSGVRHAIVLVDGDAEQLHTAAELGSLLIDGIGDALYLPHATAPLAQAFTLLQAAKARQTRADYVACPSCGRTLFDLIEVTEHIKEATAHLDGVTIAIMGCIVNGPGEMADADFGYVGSGPGVITLYHGRTPVRRKIPMQQARDALIELIKEHGMWKDPELLVKGG